MRKLFGLKTKEGNMKYALIISFSCLCFYALTGCAGSMGTIGKSHSGYFTQQGDSKGWKTHYAGIADLINEAKTKPNTVSSQYQLKHSRIKLAFMRAKEALGIPLTDSEMSLTNIPDTMEVK